MVDDIGVEIPLDPNNPLFNPEANKENWNKLPETPGKMTYHGRYDLQDKYLLKLLKMESYNSGKPVSVLDFAGGILPTGSPTAEDIYSKINSSGQKAEVHVVDSHFPPDFKPDVSDVKYFRNLREDQHQEFDIVRVLRLVEHISRNEYAEIREELISRVREGGIFVATQELGYLKRDSYGGSDPRKLGSPIIKIMQKRNGIMVPIALLPDSRVPRAPGGASIFGFDENYEELYSVWREDIGKGREELPREISDYGYENFMEWLSTMDPRVLDYESFEAQQSEGLTRLMHVDPIHPEGANIPSMLRNNAKDAAGYFSQQLQE